VCHCPMLIPSHDIAVCVAWVDYSVARTGGRTTQQVMASLAREGLVHHRTSLILGGLTGHRQNIASWNKLVGIMSEPCSNSSRGSERPPTRVALQVTDGDAKDFWSSWLPAIRKLRLKPHACCHVVLTTRVRDPLAHYLSAYEWATGGKVNLGNQLARPRTVEREGRTYSVLPRPRFHDWAPDSLQTRAFIHGGSSRLVTDEQSGHLASANDQPKRATRASTAGAPTLQRRMLDAAHTQTHTHTTTHNYNYNNYYNCL